MPITSSALSAVTSPTSASTLEVPMSRPTITSLTTLLTNAVRSWGRRGLRRMAAAFPAHCETVAVTQIDVGDVGGRLIDELRGDQHEALEARSDLLPPETHLHAVVERHVPGPALIELERHQAQTQFRQTTLGREIARGHFRLRAGRARELRTLGREKMRIGQEQLPARVQETGVVPARHRHLLDDLDLQTARPGTLHRSAIDPGERAQSRANLLEVHAHEACAIEVRAYHAFDIERRYTLQASADNHALDWLIEQPPHGAQRQHGHRDPAEGQTDAPPIPIQSRQPPAARFREASTGIAFALEHRFQAARAGGVQVGSST